MSNRVNVDLSLNSKLYEEGLDKATKATKAYETETRKISDATVAFNKELRKAKKEAMDLAAGYAQLSKADKDSEFGKEMKRQLDEALEKAAEFIDMQGDLREQMKNMASDTRVLDTLSEGFGVIANTASASLGVIAQWTGREEDARKAVVAFTTAQSALNAVSKIQAALQKQSNTMLAIAKVQTLAAAAATRLKNAAENKSIASTRMATAAQAAFNAVANANPYVLLASAIATAIGIVVSYIAVTKKATNAEHDMNRELTEHEKAIEDVNTAYMNKFASTLAELTTKYTALSNSYKKLNSEYAKTEFIKKYKTELEGVVGTVNSVYEADQKLINDTEAVKQSFVEKAKAAALYAKLQDLLVKKFEAEQQAQKAASNNNFTEGQEVRGSDVERYNLQEGVDFIRKSNEIGNGVYTAAGALKAKMAASAKAVHNAGAEYDGEINAIVDQISADNLKVSSSLKGDNKTGGKNNTAEEIKAEIGSIEALETEISRLQSLAKKGALPPELQDPDKYAAKIKSLSEQLKELKIKWGFEKPQTLKQRLEQQLSDAEYKYQIAVEGNDADAIAAARDIYIAAYTELEKHKLQLNVEKPVSDEDRRKVTNEINSIVTEALTPDNDMKWDFSDLPEEMKEAADQAMQEYNRIKDAHDELNRKMQESQDDLTISQAQQGLEKLAPALNAATAEMQKYQAAADKIKADKEQAEKLDKTINAVTSSVKSLGSAFTSVGSIAENEGFNIAGIIAQAIAELTLSWAEAMKNDKLKALGPIEWAAVGLSSVATLMSMISAIKSAQGYREGGIIGGHSYYGDKILARLNSRELVLNEDQQEDAWKMMENNAGASVSNVRVTGVIRGKDLVLVQQNVAKELSKTGKNITFG